MSPETVRRAFDAFFTTKPAGQGTGLGLAMVANFARQGGGFAEIDSEMGRGTAIRLYLPRADDQSTELPAPQRRSELIDLSGVQVAVVEDDSVVRDMMTSLLKESGCLVFEAFDGPSGLRVLESTERIDILVADIGLPGLNGRGLAHVAKAGRPELKVFRLRLHPGFRGCGDRGDPAEAIRHGRVPATRCRTRQSHRSAAGWPVTAPPLAE
jgi:hypothetical protein